MANADSWMEGRTDGCMNECLIFVKAMIAMLKTGNDQLDDGYDYLIAYYPKLLRQNGFSIHFLRSDCFGRIWLQKEGFNNTHCL